jgi:peroxiredoxin
MKKYLYILLILLYFSCLEKNSVLKKYKLTAYLNNLEDSTMVILKTFDIKSKIIDTSFSIGGKFSFTLNESEQKLLILDFMNSRKSNNYFFDFWFENKNQILIGDFENKKSIKIKNSKENYLLKKYREKPESYNNKIEKLLTQTSDKRKIKLIFQQIKDSIDKDQINLLLNNPNSFFSNWEILRFKNKIPYNKLKRYYIEIDKKKKKSKSVVTIKKYLEIKKVTIGKKFIDFSAKNKKGENVKLSDFNNKIIILDFGAYWCNLCHLQNKQVFTYLNSKYNKEIVIVSYSLDSEFDVWEKSIAKSSSEWINLSNLEGMGDPIAYSYNVNNLPHSFIIDKKGIITTEFVGYKKDSLIEKEIQKVLEQD